MDKKYITFLSMLRLDFNANACVPKTISLYENTSFLYSVLDF